MRHDELVCVRLELGLEVGDLDVASLVAGHHHHVDAGHGRAGGVGAVGRGRDQADPAMVVASAGVVGLDGQQAGQLALGAGVGLQRHRVVAGDLGQPALQLGDELAVADGLVAGRERVDRSELGPGHRDHLGGGVQLHGARAQRDHGAVQGQVAVGQAAQVAQHAVSEWCRWKTGWVRIGELAHQVRRDVLGLGADRGIELVDRCLDAERGPAPTRPPRGWWSRPG